ncbi:MAG: threonine-phosphate decarboxylase [Clostridiales bacterium]|nr:threonine-phosphate decarboxylase [Clostridiales bacterium]
MELRHGGNIYEEAQVQLNKEEGMELLDFSANINPLGMPESVRRAVTEALELAVHYPDPLCRRLRQALAEYHSLPADAIICGNGGADLIYRLAYGLRPGRALLTAPTFAEYEEALKQVGTELCFYRMQEDLQIRDDILDDMEAGLDVMFLCNPNNPTGLLIRQELLSRILERAEQRGILLVLDECFLDFTGQEERSLVEQAGKSKHLFVLRSFTKMYAMPGIRLGYGVSGRRELLDRMEESGQCWGVSVLASEAGIAALGEEAYKQEAVRLVSRERAYLQEELTALGLRVWDGQADYLFFRAFGVRDLYERLEPWGILIRRCANYRGLDDTFYRIAVKDHRSNEKLIHALRQVMNQIRDQVEPDSGQE